MYHGDGDKQGQDAVGKIEAIGRRSFLQISVHQLVVTSLLTEIILLLACGLVPYWYFGLGDDFGYSQEAATTEFVAIFLAAVIYLLLTSVTRAYDTNSILDPSHVIPRVALGLILTFGILMAIGAATKTTHFYSRIWFFTWLSSSGVLILGYRVFRLYLARRLLAKGGWVHRAISVGIFCPPMSAEAMAQKTQNRVRCVEAIRFSRLQQIASLADHIKHDLVDQIYITVPWQQAPEVMEQVDLLRHPSTDIFVIPQDRRASASLAGSSQFGNHLSLQVAKRPIRGWDVWFKRAEDVALASLALFIFAPAMLFIAIALKIESPGPILFRQKRADFNGSIFEIWKFRSMYVEDATKQTSKNDSRIIRVGRFIRETSLDELPQFFNVLQGTMSVVGPRPRALKTSAQGKLLEEIVDNYAMRHGVKPGLTGLAQVKGFRGELDSVDKLRWRVNYDLEYIDNWSIAFDLKIIFQTVVKLVYDPVAY